MMAWSVVYYLLEVFKWLIVVRAVMSWFVSPLSRHPVVELVRNLTDPVLRPISDRLPIAGGFDLSPIIVFFTILLAQQLVLRAV